MAKKQSPVCPRCGKEVGNPVPRFTNLDAPKPELLHTEIAAVEFCATCNKVIMSMIYRNNSVYFEKDFPLHFSVTEKQMENIMSWAGKKHEDKS